MQRFFAFLIATIASIGFAVASPTPTNASLAGEKLAQAPKAATADAKKSEPIDINTASAKDLATLPGIGEAYSKAIVKGRPYKGKDDLVKREVIPEKTYDGIKDKIIAKQAPR